MKTRIGFWAGSVLLFCAAASAQTVPVPNPSFEQGESAPAQWTLSGGSGSWIGEAFEGQHAIAVTGTGAAGESNYWRSDQLALEPFTVYCLRFKARRVSGAGGCPISGPGFCNRDLSDLSNDWMPYSSVFITPTDLTPDQNWIRFGQWEVNGTIAYDDVELLRAQPVYVKTRGITLGEGERVEGKAYSFVAPFSGASFNQSRPLAVNRCGFNAPRFTFDRASELVFRHDVGHVKQSSARVEVNVGLYSGGALLVQASADGQSWEGLGSIDGQRSASFDVPPGLLPVGQIWVRLSMQAGNAPGALQVHGYAYHATLEKDLGKLEGKTQFLAVPQTDPRLQVLIESVGDAVPGGTNTFVADVLNLTNQTITLYPALVVTAGNGEAARAEGTPQSIRRTFGTYRATDSEPGLYAAARVRIPYDMPGAGVIRMEFSLGSQTPYQAETAFFLSSLYSSGYGEILPQSNERAGLWWASSGWKISRNRPLPKVPCPAMRIKTARNEAEAAQLVVRPQQTLTGFTATAEALAGPNGAVLPSSSVEVLRVRYVDVAQPTDSTGAAAPWPDPLPPLKGPIDLEAGSNHPLWVRVKPPADAAPGAYAGVLHLKAEGYAADVTLDVTVFDFTLPERMACTTAFGFGMDRVFRYHQVSDPAQQRQVYDAYLAALAAHHIGPYNPAALDPFGVTWPALPCAGGVRDRGEKHGGESALRVEDGNPRGAVSAHFERLVPIPEKGVKLQCWIKTQNDGQQALLSLSHYDAGGAWMSGRNNDIVVQGSGQWQPFEQVITQFPEGATQFRLSLSPVLYVEDGSTVGTASFDDLLLSDAGSGAPLIQDGFEPLTAEQLTPAFDWSAWDAAMQRAYDTYHFNAFCVPIPGLGGGTFYERSEPSLLGYGEDTPEYKTAFSNYGRLLEAHLREKGWIKDSYVYWFDEPDPKDYDFVMNGFRKIKEAAPGVGRMLTEQVEPHLVGGPNIWCPLTPEFRQGLADERRAQGDRFWWYICTGPKAPYATLFIDHPGTELRVWLWQTWQRRIEGVLIWETSYWTSEAAYPDPDHPQNPYEDPMGWTVGYGIAPGSKAPWGNGDGRFLYPPEAAADGNPPAPVLDPPVDSYRIEMLRDGIEDYEYFALLDRLMAKHAARLKPEELAQYKALLEVPKEVTSDLTHFTTDPGPIEQRREALARAIEIVSKL